MEKTSTGLPINLPPFPASPPPSEPVKELTPEEIAMLREFLRNGFPPLVSPKEPLTSAPISAPLFEPLALLDGLHLANEERTLLATFKGHLSEVPPEQGIKAMLALSTLIPSRAGLSSLGAEETLTVLRFLSEKFLEGLAGFHWPKRREALKAVAAHLTTLSAKYTFLCQEGGTFNPQQWERLNGNQNQIMKELKGFLILNTQSRDIVYRGKTLT